MNISKYHFTLAIALTISAYGFSQQQMNKMEPVNFSQVNITDQFWKPKIDMVATKTLDACIYQTEIKTARIRNFEKVARNQGEKHEGIFYDVAGERVIALTANVPAITVGDDKMSVKTDKKKIKAIPYYTWANRGKTEM